MMDVIEAIDKWLAGELSSKEVMMATGLRSLSALYAEVKFDMHDRENEREYEDMNALQEADDLQAYEQAAYEVWSDYLRENAEGLSQCVKALREANYLGRQVRFPRS